MMFWMDVGEKVEAADLVDFMMREDPSRIGKAMLEGAGDLLAIARQLQEAGRAERKKHVYHADTLVRGHTDLSAANAALQACVG